MENSEHREFIRVVVLDSTVESQVVSSILKERRIPFQIYSYYDTAFDGLFQAQKGWGEVRAPISYHQQIFEILKDLRTSPD